jgi:hypothetical protein
LEVVDADLVISMAVTTLGKDRVDKDVVVVASYIPFQRVTPLNCMLGCAATK